MDILTFLEQNIENGHARGDEFNGDCPSPDCENPHGHFYVNLNTGRYICFHCSSSGHPFQGGINNLVKFFGLKEKIDRSESLEGIDDIEQILYQAEPASDDQGVLPDEYVPLWETPKRGSCQMAYDYVIRRGIQRADIAFYRLGYCASGRYGGRIVIPIVEGLKTVYFTARSIYGSTVPKSLNPKGSRAPFAFNLDAACRYKTIVFCEGPFSAMSVGRNALSLLGRSLSEDQIEKIFRLIGSSEKNLFVMMDSDAKESGLDISRTLSERVSSGRQKVFLVNLPFGDPADVVKMVGRKGLWGHSEILPYTNQLMLESLI